MDHYEQHGVVRPILMSPEHKGGVTQNDGRSYSTASSQRQHLPMHHPFSVVALSPEQRAPTSNYVAPRARGGEEWLDARSRSRSGGGSSRYVSPSREEGRHKANSPNGSRLHGAGVHHVVSDFAVALDDWSRTLEDPSPYHPQAGLPVAAPHQVVAPRVSVGRVVSSSPERRRSQHSTKVLPMSPLRDEGDLDDEEPPLVVDPRSAPHFDSKSPRHHRNAPLHSPARGSSDDDPGAIEDLGEEHHHHHRANDVNAFGFDPEQHLAPEVRLEPSPQAHAMKTEGGVGGENKPAQWRLAYQVPKDCYGRYSPERERPTAKQGDQGSPSPRNKNPNRGRSPAGRATQGSTRVQSPTPPPPGHSSEVDLLRRGQTTTVVSMATAQSPPRQEPPKVYTSPDQTGQDPPHRSSVLRPSTSVACVTTDTTPMHSRSTGTAPRATVVDAGTSPIQIQEHVKQQQQREKPPTQLMREAGVQVVRSPPPPSSTGAGMMLSPSADVKLANKMAELEREDQLHQQRQQVKLAAAKRDENRQSNPVVASISTVAAEPAIHSSGTSKQSAAPVSTSPSDGVQVVTSAAQQNASSAPAAGVPLSLKGFSQQELSGTFQQAEAIRANELTSSLKKTNKRRNQQSSGGVNTDPLPPQAVVIQQLSKPQPPPSTSRTTPPPETCNTAVDLSTGSSTSGLGSALAMLEQQRSQLIQEIQQATEDLTASTQRARSYQRDATTLRQGWDSQSRDLEARANKLRTRLNSLQRTTD